MAGFDPYAGRQNLSMWKSRIVSYLSPHYEDANEILEMNVVDYNKTHGLTNSKI